MAAEGAQSSPSESSSTSEEEPLPLIPLNKNGRVCIF